MRVGYDILGNIAVLKFDRGIKASEKKKFAEEFLKRNKSVKTVVEKIGKFRGRLRIQKTKYIAGEKTKEALYKENGCVFRLNADSCYFSSRLASERAEIAKKTKKKESVLVMFGGIAVYAIVIAKLSKPSKVVSAEISKECNKYARINVKRNKVGGIVEIMQGDVRRALPKIKDKFDRIVMPRPNLKDSFLDLAFQKIEAGGVIHYYGFSSPVPPKLSINKTKSYGNNSIKRSSYDTENKKLGKDLEKRDINALKELIEKEAKKSRRKIKILKIKKAGDIAPYKFRYRADFKVLN